MITELLISTGIVGVLFWLPILRTKDKTFNPAAFGLFGVVYNKVLEKLE